MTWTWDCWNKKIDRRCATLVAERGTATSAVDQTFRELCRCELLEFSNPCVASIDSLGWRSLYACPLQPGAGEAPAYAAFERRRREPGETVRQFVYSLRLQCERAFPNVSSSAREAVLMRRFKSGIPEKYGRMLMSGPRLHSLEDAVERTQQLITIDQQFPEHTVASAVNENGNWMEMERKLNEISARLDHLMMGSPYELESSAALQQRPPNVGRRRYRGGRGPQCWNCGRYGHMARVCRREGQGPPPSGERDARQVGWLNDQGRTLWPHDRSAPASGAIRIHWDVQFNAPASPSCTT
uniref:CCHC-type domain-containing protein n=1 Tax=Trichuris muris TaxID=70415 RepID=A0A5S6QTU5_TRIMR